MTNALIFVFPLAMAFAAASDLLTMRISNKLVLALAAAFFVVALVISMPLQDVAMHLLCGFVVLVVAFLFFAFGWIGGGDAKLAAATALWLGMGQALPYVLNTAVLGGLLTLLLLAFRRLPLTPLIARVAWIERLHNSKSGIPYGIAMAAAGMLVYAKSPIFLALSV